MRLFSDYLHYTRAIGAPCAAALLLAGCAEVTGGGYMRSADAPAAKANFALSLVCNENGYLVGHWVYHDKGSQGRVRVHGRVSEPLAIAKGFTCDPQAEEPGGRGSWLGLPYRSQGPPQRRGTADISVTDGNTGGPATIKGDRLTITLRRASDGRVWYRNEGPVRGGNLKVVQSPVG